ncbi:MAG: hypothetical protein ACRDGS_08845, partial [Chloroflexota bacterium]
HNLDQKALARPIGVIAWACYGEHVPRGPPIHVWGPPMEPNEPRQLILYNLTLPLASRNEAPDPLRAADPASVRFVRAVAAPGRYLQAVEYTDLHGDAWHYVFYLRQNGDGRWTMESGGGGGGGLVTRPYPSLNLAASWGQFGMWAGGRVSDLGTGVTRARLRGPDGLVVEDTITDGYALFMTDRPVPDPSVLEAELYNAAGDLVGSHKPFPQRR